MFRAPRLALCLALMVLPTAAACSKVLGLEDPQYVTVSPTVDASVEDVRVPDESATPTDAASDRAVFDGSSVHPPMLDVGMGAYHGCALGDDGSVRCWGANADGQLGTGTNGGDQPFATPVAGLPKITQLSVGMTHSCGVAADQSVWCWGSNAKGALGFDPAGDPQCAERCSVARAIPGLRASQVLALWDTTCAVTSTGVMCWGANETGIIDLPLHSSTSIPTAVPGLGSNASSIGGNPWPGGTVCLLTPAQNVACWGSNDFGSVGHAPGMDGDKVSDAGTTYRSDPSIVTLADTQSLGQLGQVSGNRTSCAVRLDGRLFCWGTDSCGQLAESVSSASVDAGGAPHPQPENAIDLGSIIDVRSGDAVCARLSDGRVYCWGDDTSGLVGASVTESCTSFDGLPNAIGQRAPVQRPNLLAKAISIGFRAAAAVDMNGNVLAWGKNESGQLGHPAGTRGDVAAQQDRNPLAQFVDGLGP